MRHHVSGLWRRLVGWGFRLLYHEMAWSYDAVAWSVSLGQWKEWGRAALPYLTGERVLEIGHGPGHLLVALAERGYLSVGLDASPQMGKMAQRRLRQRKLPARLARGQAQALPFAAHAFDSVVVTFPTVYIVDPATLQEVARVLNRGGRLVVVVGARLCGRDPVSRGVERLYRITGQRESLNEDDWRRRFNAAGLAVQQMQVEMPRSCVLLWVATHVSRDDRIERESD